MESGVNLFLRPLWGELWTFQIWQKSCIGDHGRPRGNFGVPTKFAGEDDLTSLLRIVRTPIAKAVWGIRM